MKYYLFLLFPLVLASCRSNQPVEENEILWDTWGIPHIYATSDAELYEMFGWAQMRNHGDLILKLYGEARARSSEYWGGEVQRDKLLHQMGVIKAAEKAYELLSEADREMIEAFALGLNAYAEKHPDHLDERYRPVLPVTARDVVAHSFRVMYLEFLINREIGLAARWSPGSNAWAVNGAKTVTGNSLLLANPHLPWEDFWLFFEAHLITPQNRLYGVTLVGLPVLGIAFNENLGWTHTVNTLDNVDLYEINIRDGQYELDGGLRDFEVDSVQVIQRTDTTTNEQTIVIKRSAFGMILRESGDKALAVSWPNMDGAFNQLGQWRAMGEAQSLEQFQEALNRNALPLFNVVYGDRAGNILYHFGGNVPRKNGDWRKWQGIVPANSSEELWKGFYAANELPGYVNPENHWIQNANDPPYTSTLPPVKAPHEFPAHVAPNYMDFRSQRSARLIREADPLTLEEFVDLKHDTRSELALRLKDEMEELKTRTKDSLTLAALEVLTSWDAAFDSASTGAPLFINFVNKIGTNGIFEKNWSFEDPLDTPDGFKDEQSALAALKEAAEAQLAQLGTLRASFGDLFRFKVGDYEYAGNGGFGHLGLFRTMNYVPGPDGKFYAYHGDSYVCATEFGEKVRARALLSYGNATQPNNPHVGDQLKLLAEKKLREVWLNRAEQEANLELVEKLGDR